MRTTASSSVIAGNSAACRLSFAYGILGGPTAPRKLLASMLNPSKKQGYDATVHFLMMTERGAKEHLQPLIESCKVREWIKTSWPFAIKMAFHPKGLDVGMSDWNVLPDTGL